MIADSPFADLTGRVAVVIGGGSGIGRGIALGLAGEGMQVVVADIDAASADAVRSEIEAAGGTALAAHIDATDRGSLGELADHAVRELGAVHVLVNTVGAIVDRRLDEATEDDWGWMLELNLMAQVRSVAVFLPRLRASGGPAHILLTSSMAGLLASPPDRSRGFHLGLYTTAKHALIGFSEMLRLELAPEGIGVSVLCPTRVAGNLAVTSARNRPERFGGPTEDPQGGQEAPLELIPNEAVGPLVVRGIRANRFYIFTHPEAVKLVEESHRQLLDDVAFGT